MDSGNRASVPLFDRYLYAIPERVTMKLRSIADESV
jgi:hypothetical protein